MLHKDRVLLYIAQIEENGVQLIHQISPTFLELAPEDRFHTAGDVCIDFIAKNVGSSILVQGTIKTTISCECDRCLEKFDYPVDIDDYCQYFDNFDDYIDLTDTIREDILLAFPTRPLCQPDCIGFCPICGTNLNISECECDQEILEEEEESEEASGIWSCFDNIDLNDLEEK